MTDIPSEPRSLVRARAGNCCEYCLVAEEDSFFSHEVDHIIAEKHRGRTEAGNLALSCFNCNRHKGSDISSVDLDTLTLTPLFNPLTHRWEEHFGLNGPVIVPLTAEGRVTAFLLRLNDEPRISRRTALLALNRYPCQLPSP